MVKETLGILSLDSCLKMSDTSNTNPCFSSHFVAYKLCIHGYLRDSEFRKLGHLLKLKTVEFVADHHLKKLQLGRILSSSRVFEEFI